MTVTKTIGEVVIKLEGTPEEIAAYEKLDREMEQEANSYSPTINITCQSLNADDLHELLEKVKQNEVNTTKSV